MSKNTSIKRIKADIRELHTPPLSKTYHAVPTESNLYDWHFTLRGPPSTPFHNGLYHGRIILPPEYPFKPPDIIFLTENGRFKVGTKICLSISSYHPEHWQPCWGIRLILEALISFLPTPSDGAIGGLDYRDDERKLLATKSLDFCCARCGNLREILPDLTEEEEKEIESGGGVKYGKEIESLMGLPVQKEEVEEEEKEPPPTETATATATATEKETATVMAELVAAELESPPPTPAPVPIPAFIKPPPSNLFVALTDPILHVVYVLALIACVLTYKKLVLFVDELNSYQ